MSHRTVVYDPIENEVVLPYLIPLHEATRINYLHETNLLFSSQEDPSFDRLTAFAKRLFNVPVAMVSLVDSKRVWLKSTAGMEAKGTDSHRNYGFCSHVILPQNPDVFVVPDATLDPRFCNNPNVLDFLKVRFYAGAALTIGSVRIGSFCVIDFVPRHDFDVNCVLNLLDLGEAASCLIRERRNSYIKMKKEIEKKEKNIVLASERQRAKLMLEMMHKVRTPLMSIAMTSSLIETDCKGKKQQDSELNTDSINKSHSNFSEGIEHLVVDLKSAVKSLEDVVEASLLLGDTILQNVASTEAEEGNIDEGSEKDDEDYSDNYILCGRTSQDVNLNVFDENHIPTECNVLLFINEAKNRIQHSLVNCKSHLEWTIDNNKLSDKPFLTYPLLISYIFHILEKDIVNFWLAINVEIWLSNVTNNSDNSPVPSGNLVIQINASKRGSEDNNNEVHFSQMRGRSRSCSAADNEMQSSSYQCYDSLLNKLSIIEKQLCSVDGTLRVVDFEESEAISLSNDKLFEFHIPFMKIENESVISTSIEDRRIYSRYASVEESIEKVDDETDRNINPSQLLKCLDAAAVGGIGGEGELERKRGREATTTTTNSYRGVGQSTRSSIRNSINNTHSNLNNNNINNTSSRFHDSIDRNEGGERSHRNSSHLTTTTTCIPTTISQTTSDHPLNGEEVEVSSNSRIDYCDSNSNRILRHSLKSNDCQRSPTPAAVTVTPEGTTSDTISRLDRFTSRPVHKKPTVVRNLFLRVLVVDDSAAIRKVMEKWLKKSCCEVVLAENGKIGLLLMQQECFDFVLLDFLMPVMIGRDTLRNFQDWRTNHPEDDLNRDMIIVGMSANSSLDDQNECFQFGMHFFSSKPVSMEGLQILLEAKRETNDLQRITREVLRTCPMFRTYVDSDAIHYPSRKPMNNKVSPCRTPTKSNSITSITDVDNFSTDKLSVTSSTLQDLFRDVDDNNNTITNTNIDIGCSSRSHSHSAKIHGRNIFRNIYKDDNLSVVPVTTEGNIHHPPNSLLILDENTLSHSANMTSISSTSHITGSAKSRPLSTRTSSSFMRSTGRPISGSNLLMEAGGSRSYERADEQSSTLSRVGTTSSDSPTSVIGNITTYIASAIFSKKSAKVVQS